MITNRNKLIRADLQFPGDFLGGQKWIDRLHLLLGCPDLNKLAMMSDAPFQIYVRLQHVLVLDRVSRRLSTGTTQRSLHLD